MKIMSSSDPQSQSHAHFAHASSASSASSAYSLHPPPSFAAFPSAAGSSILFPNRQQEPYFEPSRTLFLGDLSFFCTEDDLCTLFARYGAVTAVRVRRGVTGESLLHGFIAFQSPESTFIAVRELDGKEFMGRNIRVQLGTSIHQGTMDRDKFVQLHVSFISKQLNFLVSESVLREIFVQFGDIADVTIKRHTKVVKQKRQTGYGFVYYYEVDPALRAIKTLKHATVHDITFDCSVSYKSGQIKPTHIPAHVTSTTNAMNYGVGFESVDASHFPPQKGYAVSNQPIPSTYGSSLQIEPPHARSFRPSSDHYDGQGRIPSIPNRLHNPSHLQQQQQYQQNFVERSSHSQFDRSSRRYQENEERYNAAPASVPIPESVFQTYATRSQVNSIPDPVYEQYTYDSTTYNKAVPASLPGTKNTNQQPSNQPLSSSSSLGDHNQEYYRVNSSTTSRMNTFTPKNNPYDGMSGSHYGRDHHYNPQISHHDEGTSYFSNEKLGFSGNTSNNITRNPDSILSSFGDLSLQDSSSSEFSQFHQHHYHSVNLSLPDPINATTTSTTTTKTLPSIENSFLSSSLTNPLPMSSSYNLAYPSSTNEYISESFPSNHHVEGFTIPSTIADSFDKNNSVSSITNSSTEAKNL